MKKDEMSDAEPISPAPRAAQPGAAEPGAAEPGAFKPGAVEPGTAQPEAVEPGGPEPGEARTSPAEPAAGEENLVPLLWPVVKRLPAYVKLAWALIRDPAISRRHKAPLYAAITYVVTPIHYPVSLVPVLGTIDSPAALLLGIRQALAHCPTEKVEEHLSQLNLKTTQVDDDLSITLGAALQVTSRVAHGVERRVRFGGRLAALVGQRALRRVIGHSPTLPPEQETPGGPDTDISSTHASEHPTSDP